MQYRSDLLMGLFSVGILNWVNLTLIYVIISDFTGAPGLVLLGDGDALRDVAAGDSVYAVFFWHVSTIEDDILQGRFDQYMFARLPLCSSWAAR